MGVHSTTEDLYDRQTERRCSAEMNPKLESLITLCSTNVHMDDKKIILNYAKVLSLMMLQIIMVITKQNKGFSGDVSFVYVIVDNKNKPNLENYHKRLRIWQVEVMLSSNSLVMVHNESHNMPQMGLKHVIL